MIYVFLEQQYKNRDGYEGRFRVKFIIFFQLIFTKTFSSDSVMFSYDSIFFLTL